MLQRIGGQRKDVAHPTWLYCFVYHHVAQNGVQNKKTLPTLPSCIPTNLWERDKKQIYLELPLFSSSAHSLSLIESLS
jgi:hypothetical protein